MPDENLDKLRVRCPVCLLPDTPVYNGKDEVVVKIHHPYRGKIVMVKGRYIDWVGLTPEHQVLTKSLRFSAHRRFIGKKPRWKNAIDLRVPNFRGSRELLVIPKEKERKRLIYLNLTPFEMGHGGQSQINNKLLLTENLARLLGWYVAEGFSIEGKDSYFALGKDEKEHVDEVLGLIQSLGYKGNVKEVATGTVISIGSRILSRALPEWCGTGARNKIVPSFIFPAKQSIIRAFLDGYIKGDGTSHLKNGRPHVQAKSTSRDLMRGIQRLYLKLGMPFGIGEGKGGKNIQGRKVNVHQQWQIQGHTDGKNGSRNCYWQDKDNFYFPVQDKKVIDYEGEVVDYQTTSGFIRIPFIVKNCGYLCYAHQILEQEEPFEVELKEMNFVGSSRLSAEERLHRAEIGRRTRGAGRGKIEYRPVESELIADIRARFKKICRKFLKE